MVRLWRNPPAGDDMPTLRTEPAHWPLDQRKLLPQGHQQAAWRALADSRDLLADIALTMKLLSATAFTGQAASVRLSAALHTALLDLEIELGQQGIVEFRAPK